MLFHNDSTSPKLKLHFLGVLFIFICTATSAFAETTSIFDLQPSSAIGGSPSSLLMETTYINVPAGAMLSVHLMKGQQVLSTSKLQFMGAHQSSSFLPTQIAQFYSSGSPTPGEPIPGTKLTPGIIDLTGLAANPEQFQLLWSLSSGEIYPPGQALVTGGSQPINFARLRPVALAASRQSDQKPGSVLFYHRYTSSLSNPNAKDTTISLTNTSFTDTGKVRLFFVNGQDCLTFDVAVCLSAQQTTSFRMSEYDPGTTGYVVAVAIDNDGKPTQFNWLIGNAQIRQISPINSQSYDTSLSATAVFKRSSAAISVTNGKAEMAFDDAMYDSLPSQIAADNIPSQGTSAQNANATFLGLYRPTGDLSGSTVAPKIDFSLFNNQGGTSVASTTLGCYADLRLNTIRFNPLLATILPTGQTGWVRISAPDKLPIMGAQFSSGASYATGATLRAIMYAPDYRILVPVKIPGC